MIHFADLTRAEMAAVIVETLSSHGIEVALVGGGCVCVYTDERFGSFDLDFIDLTYARRNAIVAALADIGFTPRGNSKYFEHPDCRWSVEFPTGPLAIGEEQIPSDKLATLETAYGTVRLLSTTDSVKDRLLWWYLTSDSECWLQALDIATHHRIVWADLQRWHVAEGHAERFRAFRREVDRLRAG